jgi:hypothetical protein
MFGIFNALRRRIEVQREHEGGACLPSAAACCGIFVQRKTARRE